MASPPTVQELLARHVKGQASHEPITTIEERVKAGGQAPKVFVVTCADPRCIPEKFLHLETWEVVVLRTAGSDVQAALPSIIAIDSLFELDEIMVINHTDCGALMFRDDVIKSKLKDRAPQMGKDIDAMTFGEITGTLEDRVREHVDIARNSPYLRNEIRANATGYVFDIKSGKLTPVQ